jgi:NTP pyrophosphatase (non-canonical NTP hydrolase)
MKRQEHLILCLAEECAEITHVVSKILRFGLHDNWPGYGDKLERLTGEINDLLGVVEFLQENGVPLPGLTDRRAIEAKKVKLQEFLDYARKHGALDD